MGKVPEEMRIFEKIFFHCNQFHCNQFHCNQFLTLKNMVTKFFQNSNFSDFLGIKSEISQWFTKEVNSWARIKSSLFVQLELLLVKQEFLFYHFCAKRNEERK